MVVSKRDLGHNNREDKAGKKVGMQKRRKSQRREGGKKGVKQKLFLILKSSHMESKLPVNSWTHYFIHAI
jgi:hypothetical protein